MTRNFKALVVKPPSKAKPFAFLFRTEDNRCSSVPWLNWIEQDLPKVEVAGSSPAGIVYFQALRKLRPLKIPFHSFARADVLMLY